MGSEFSHEKGGVSKIGGITYFQTIWPFPMLSFWVFGVCMCVLFIYTISVSIVCVSQEKHTVIKSNQQRYMTPTSE